MKKKNFALFFSSSETWLYVVCYPGFIDSTTTQRQHRVSASGLVETGIAPRGRKSYSGRRVDRNRYRSGLLHAYWWWYTIEMII